MKQSRLEQEMSRAKPTKEEAEIMLNAQGDYIKNGQTVIRCPRCGKPLEFRHGESGSAIYCSDDDCIIMYCRGL